MEKVIILGLILNFITLVFVFFQTRWTKKSVDIAQGSIELTKTSKQLEMLPRIHFIIWVKLFLNEWNDELKEIIKYLEEDNKEGIIKFSKTSIKREGLIDKYYYEPMPDWLSIIYATGAQYYYNSSCLYKNLNKNTKKDDYFERFKESSDCLEILLKYIKDEVPEVFLNCPASLNTNDFFSLK